MTDVNHFDMSKTFYSSYLSRLASIRACQHRHLTYTEKIIYVHQYSFDPASSPQRGTDYVDLHPDRVAMQDATAQMALLQFMNAGRDKVAVPTTVPCDHLIRAHQGADKDLQEACRQNAEVYDFLRSAAARYGIGFWKAGAGIIHQIILENYALPGQMMIGTDSHTPNAGGLGMMAIGVGGADAVDVLTDEPWQLKMPRIIGVRLTGTLPAWSSPKDIILHLLGLLTVKGGTHSVIEYFGPGISTISATGRATICNMGAELGATCSLFPCDGNTLDYLKATGREDLEESITTAIQELGPDQEVINHPEKYYDQVIDINLSTLSPYLNGPFTPDAATPLPKMKAISHQAEWPTEISTVLIGSCTNSSYEDLSTAASVAQSALAKGLKARTHLIVCPGSEQVRRTAERDGLLDTLRQLGAVIMANACGPCIGQWDREGAEKGAPNSIITTFNRNFRRRADGNPNTYAFIASPAIAVALAVAGRMDFDPSSDSLIANDGTPFFLPAPFSDTLPTQGFSQDSNGYISPSANSQDITVSIAPDSNRIQKLEPFAPWDGKDMIHLHLLVKVKGKCTTDHISMAGPWLRFRGHLENISDNLLMGAVNAFNDKTDMVLDQLTGEYTSISTAAKSYKSSGLGSIIVAEENYGEGSSREHAAMEPRFLGVKAVLAKSFARIHETNLKKQGMLALIFTDKDDYNKIREKDTITIGNLEHICPGSTISITLLHEDGSSESFTARHTYDNKQIAWLRAGSALNYLKSLHQTSKNS